MKFYSVAASVIAIICALFAAAMQAYQGQFFRCFLLCLFVIMQCDILAIRMHVERELIDPDTKLRRK